MRRILIIGATSAIAAACARRWAARGERLYLVARDAAALQARVGELESLAAGCIAGHATLDVLEPPARHAAVLDGAWSALGEVDVVLLAHGALPDAAACDADVDAALAAFDVNARATIALLVALAQRLRGRRGATIAAIGSVAGERGRAANALYGAAKAAVATYLSGLRQRLQPDGVNVLTVLPGFVDTPMTRALPKGPLWASAEAVAAGIVRAIDRRRPVVRLPWFWTPAMWLVLAIPEPLFRRLRF